MERILVIEDDPAIAMGLKDDLAFEGFSVSLAGDGARGLRLATEEAFHLIILDVLLPGLNGFEVLGRLREARVFTPVLMLTAAKTEEADKVRGLELGADDYMTKPFGARELMARVKAILRRTADRSREPQEYRFGDFVLDFKTRELSRKGDRIHLTALEYRLLRHLIEHRAEVVSRADLMKSVWHGVVVSPNTIEPHIVYLRKKIEENPARPRHILSVRGVGYRFVE